MRVAHLRCGDDLRGKLPAAGFTGDYLTYVDPVCQGPVPAEDDEARFVEIRANFVADAYGAPLDEARQRLRAEQASLAGLHRYDRVVLWFEHDWFDQAILVRLLATLADRAELTGRLYLLSVNDFPESRPFYGFGQLSPAQLATLDGRAEPVTAAQLALARRAWDALRAPTPEPLQSLVDGRDRALPYLADAVRRHLQELPWTADGLSLTERLCLGAVASGARGLQEIFPVVQAADPYPYHGDLQLVPVLNALAVGQRPALTATADGWTPTRHAAALLSAVDSWRTAGRWVGGVWLDPPEWHWDAATGRITVLTGPDRS